MKNHKTYTRQELNQHFLDRTGWSDEQKKDFEELYDKYYRYVFKYEVRHEEDFKPENMSYYNSYESFANELDDAGMCIKVNEGY